MAQKIAITEDTIFLNFFPTVEIKGDNLSKLLNLFEENPKLMPEKWGNDERMRTSYDRQTIQKLVKEGRGVDADEIFLYRNKHIKYEVKFETRLYYATFLRADFSKFSFRGKENERNKKVCLDLSDQIANLTKPTFGTNYILFADIAQKREKFKEEEFISSKLMSFCGDPIPIRFSKEGPWGIGTRTYFGKELIELFGRDFLLQAPAYVHELEWGGIRIDLVEEPWNADLETILKKWIEVMKYLEVKNIFAKFEKYELHDGNLWVDPKVTPIWETYMKNKKEAYLKNRKVSK